VNGEVYDSHEDSPQFLPFSRSMGMIPTEPVEAILINENNSVDHLSDLESLINELNLQATFFTRSLDRYDGNMPGHTVANNGEGFRRASMASFLSPQTQVTPAPAPALRRSYAIHEMTAMASAPASQTTEDPRQTAPKSQTPTLRRNYGSDHLASYFSGSQSTSADDF
jgi:hypothetical protein